MHYLGLRATPGSTDNAPLADAPRNQHKDSNATVLSPEARRTLASIFRRAAPSAKKAALRILREPSAADDAVQTVFARAIGGPHVSQPGRFEDAYFIRAARNEALSMLRKSRKEALQIPLTADLAAKMRDPSPRPDEMAAAAEEQELLRRAIGRLPPRCREIVSRIAFEGMTRAQVASELGISVKAVERQMTRAYAKLRSGAPGSSTIEESDVGGMRSAGVDIEERNIGCQILNSRR